MIKCGQRRTFDAVRRGIRDLRWDSAGSSGILSGVPGCDHDYDDQNLFLAETPVVAPLLEYQGVSE